MAEQAKKRADGSGKKNRRRKKPDPFEKMNRNILRVAYLFVFLFLAMMIYLTDFLIFHREEVINNTYNSRLDSFAEYVVKGQIRSNDGSVLARTTVDQDGQETRKYPFGPLFAHAVGQDFMGKTGLESLGEFYMLSSHTNMLERVVRELAGEKSPGDDIYTTLDVQLQQIAYDELGDRKGAVIALEPDTGKILVMVSKPGYDANLLEEEWELLVKDSENARLLNRGTQGVYPPGSIFKIVTLLEYLRENPDGYETYRFNCDGIFEADGYKIQCYHQIAHGSQTLAQAFANSCNGAFASLGLSLDIQSLNQTAEELLYDQELPLAVEYKKGSFALSEDAREWEISQTAIGQGRTQTTPMHSTMITAAIANGGILMKPYLIDRVENVEGKLVKQFLPEGHGSVMTAEESKLLTEMLSLVVAEGTGSKVRTEAYTVAGKTGSAEFETGKETHAWFTGFAPADRPKLVVTVLVEESGSGGNVAAPIARKLFDAYFHVPEEGRQER